jgi:hypothetical protein
MHTNTKSIISYFFTKIFIEDILAAIVLSILFVFKESKIKSLNLEEKAV